MRKHDSKKPSSGVRPGFTLVEMLVVITIIAVLVAISLIGMRKVRAMAHKANSTRNIAQLQIANITYASDHHSRCVPIRANDENGNATRWFHDMEFLANLIGSSGQLESNATPIPLNMLDPKVVRAGLPLHDRVYTSYGMNDTGLQLGGDPNLNSSHNMNLVANPSRSMAFATATDFRVNYNSRFKWDFKNPNDSKTAAGDLAYRHNDKILVVYFDGHVGEMSKAALEQIDDRGGRSNAFWNPKSK